VKIRTQYARAGDVHIAYQVVGEGPFDLVFVPGILSHLDSWWDDPAASRFFRRLASFSRLLLFDKRGLGLSDRPPGWPALEERMDDIRAVMDAAGSERAAMLGVSEGGPLSVMFAASHPERCRSLALVGSFARMARSDDYPVGVEAARILAIFDDAAAHWGEPGLMRLLAPTLYKEGTAAQRESWGRFERNAASPGAILTAIRMNLEIDVREVLPQIRVPTLVLHRDGDRAFPLEAGRYLAEHIPDARLVVLPGRDHIFWHDPEPLLDELQEFFTGSRVAPETDRVLATVLFTDLVGSTRLAAELGDAQFAQTLERFHAATRRGIARFRGEVMDEAGDGVLATFDGPARAIRCARSLRDEMADMGLVLRAALHSGECERLGAKVGGIAVHIGARILAQAAPGEILVSSTVRDLVAGSGLAFRERGTRALEGVPGDWRLLAVADDETERMKVA
jgi:pimeloyl-ACP methyl ester carboxylesterase/class 3 adenylate cyclase